jgi:hypothetical protein
VVYLSKKTRVLKMTLKVNFMDAVSEIEKILNDVCFMIENRAKETYFTRNPTMEFKEIIMFSLYFVKKSMQLELDDFFKILKREDTESIRKSSYTEARNKVSPNAFIKMLYHIIKWYYDNADFKTYKGYRLSAIDGSKFEIPDTEILRKEFGSQSNQYTEVARAMVSGIYDIENDKFIAAAIAKYNIGEIDIAIQLIEEMKKNGLKNDLIIFDRGYPSTELVSYLQDSNIKYLMRCSTSFLKVVINTKSKDEYVEIINEDGKILKTRVVKVMLDSEQEEILITNLTPDEFNTAEMKELYFRRWNIETKYNEIKNRLQIENFTGCTPTAIKQDFYANILLTNMVSLAKEEANEIIKENNADKELKYEYKVNTNILIGKFKDLLVNVLLEKNTKKRLKIFRRVMTEIYRHVVPIRPGRSKPRKKKITTNKYQLNNKRAL